MAVNLLLPIGVLFIAIGALLLKRGHWPRRVGDLPHCGKCDYILSGPQQRCPECGTVVQLSTIVRGERHRRPGLALLGGGIGLLGLAFIALVAAGVASNLPWVRIEPLSWLLRDLGRGNTSGGYAAWTEIQRRIDGDLLSDDQQNAVVERGLQLQAAGTAPLGQNTNVLDFVASRFFDHKLSSQQTDRFFANALKMKLTARRVIGTKSPVSYSASSAGGQGPTSWMLRVRMLEEQIDNGPIEKLGGEITTSFAGTWSSGGTLPSMPNPGKHRLRIKAELAAYPAAAGWSFTTPPIKRVTSDLTSDFQVIGGPTPVTTTTEPQASVLRALLSPQVRRSDANPHWLDVQIRAATPPVDLAFDVFIRCNGKEYTAMSVNFHKGGEGNYGTTASDFPVEPIPKVDVILRSNESVAATTLDMTQIWKGEIVFKDVPLQPASVPTTVPAATQPG